MKTPDKKVWQQNKDYQERGQGSHVVEIAYEIDCVLEACEFQD